MLVDRNLIVDLIVLESKRENRDRHPHCIVVVVVRNKSKKREKAESCMKNTHVQILN
jgi:hypothetical protein